MDIASVRQEVTVFLPYDFLPDMAVHGDAGMIYSDMIRHTRLLNTQSLIERVGRLGLSEAAEDVRRKLVSVVDTFITTRKGRGWWTHSCKLRSYMHMKRCLLKFYSYLCEGCNQTINVK